MDTIIDRPQGVNMPVAHITLADVSSLNYFSYCLINLQIHQFSHS